MMGSVSDVSSPLEVTFSRVPVGKILGLRHRILLPDQPPESVQFDGDHEPTTIHLAGEVDGRIVACATMMLRPWQDEPAWQLRGMAVDKILQCRGIGRRLLTQIEQAALAAGHSSLFWCNARTPAVEFYQRLGWRTVGDVFEIPNAGPHVRMIRTPERR
jgi:predicted GNAT family N-acyltransferase